MEVEEKRKIMIIGATGYLGNYMVRASLSMGHPTFAYVRPLPPPPSPPPAPTHSFQSLPSFNHKLLLLQEFQSMGVTIIYGELGDHEKLVSALRLVDVVVSTLPVPLHLQQLNIITAIKEAGNIKRFVPSEFGNEVDRVRALPAFQELLDNKKKIRRATQEAHIPYTYVSANSFAAYFVDYLLHPRQTSPHLTIYGSGQAKAYTIKAATDPRARNRLDLVSSWQIKTGRTFQITHLPEQQIIQLTRSLPRPDNIAMAILHNIFVEGAQLSFELEEKDLEASKLYPDYNYTSVDSLLDICLVNPPNPKLASFA
ncbi:Isoeugenol synthase [Bertholletia excelsa]